MPFNPVYLPLILISVIALAIGLAYVHERRRRRAFETAARDLGMTFQAKGTTHPALGQRFALFQRGRHARMGNILEGRIEDLDALIFDYRYVTGSGKNRTVYRQSVVALRQPGVDLPRLELRPEHFFHKIGELLGMRDIDFDSHPTFSKRLHLSGKDESAIRAIFDESLLGFFESIVKERLCVEAHGEHVIVYRQRKRMKPTEVASRLTEAFDVATQLWSRAGRATVAPATP